ncbi:MAG: DUF6288 domain-containing protein [Planctomycetota bacterium]
MVLDSGRAVEGEIIKETPYEVVVKLPSGISVTIARDEIIEIKRKTDVVDQFKKKRAAVRDDDLFSLMELAKWCKQYGLKEQQKEVLQTILKLDSTDGYATRELAILEGKLPPPKEGEENKSEDDEITWEKQFEGKEIVKNVDKKIFEETKKSNKKKYKRIEESKNKPKGANSAALKGLQYLSQKGWHVKYAHAGRVVTTAFTGLAFLASGSDAFINRINGTTNQVAVSIKKYCIGKRPPAGKFDQANWALGIGGMFLNEALYVYKSSELRNTLQQVVNQLVINIEESGGYGHDGSGQNVLGYTEVEIVSNFVVSTFGMAKSQGVKIPKEKEQAAVDYISKCFDKKGIAYSHVNKGTAHVGRTAGAVFALTMAKQQDNEVYNKLCDIVNSQMDQVIYGHASPALSFFQTAIGSIQMGQETWDSFVEKWFPVILEHQNPDGSFRPILNKNEPGMNTEENMGPAYATSIYTLILLLDKGNLHFHSTCFKKEKEDKPEE